MLMYGRRPENEDREKLACLKEYHGLLVKWLHEDDLDQLIHEKNYRNISTIQASLQSRCSRISLR